MEIAPHLTNIFDYAEAARIDVREHIARIGHSLERDVQRMFAKPKRQKSKPLVEDELPPPTDEWQFGVESLDALMAVANAGFRGISAIKEKNMFAARSELLLQRREIAKSMRVGGLLMGADKESVLNVRRVDMRYGPLPGTFAAGFSTPNSRDDWTIAMFFGGCQMQTLPPGVLPTGPGWPYCITALAGFRKDGAMTAHYVTIDRDGCIHPTKFLNLQNRRWHTKDGWLYVSNKVYTLDRGIAEKPYTDSNGTIIHPIVAQTAAVLSCWRLAEAQWQVLVSDGGGNKLRFPVAPQSVIRIFRERDSQGRRAAILHWVRAHEREGSKRGVRTHLRGAIEFEHGGYHFLLQVPGTKTTEKFMPELKSNGSIELNDGEWAVTNRLLAAILRINYLSEERLAADLERSGEDEVIAMKNLPQGTYYGEARAQ